MSGFAFLFPSTIQDESFCIQANQPLFFRLSLVISVFRWLILLMPVIRVASFLPSLFLLLREKGAFSDPSVTIRRFLTAPRNDPIPFFFSLNERYTLPLFFGTSQRYLSLSALPNGCAAR